MNKVAYYLFGWWLRTAWLSLLVPSAVMLFLCGLLAILITVGGAPGESSMDSWRVFVTDLALASDVEWAKAENYMTSFLKYVFWFLVPVVIFWRSIRSNLVEQSLKRFIGDPVERLFNRLIANPIQSWYSAQTKKTQSFVSWGSFASVIMVIGFLFLMLPVSNSNKEMPLKPLVLDKHKSEKQDRVVVRLPDGTLMSGKAIYQVKGSQVVLNFEESDDGA